MNRNLVSMVNRLGVAWPVWAPAAFFFSVAAIFALACHYPILYFDHWDIVPFYQRLVEGALKPGDLFAPHGTHWHAGGYAVLLALAPFTGMTQTPEIITNLLLALIACTALYVCLRNAWRELGGPFSALLFAVAAFFLFSLDQSENWLWGWQVSVFLNVAGSTVCLALLARQKLTAQALAGAMLAACLAIYSFATGLALLPAGLVVLLLKRPRFDLRLAAWLAFSAAVALHYKLAVLDVHPAYVSSITPHSLGVSTLVSLAGFALEIVGGAVGRFTDGLPLIAAVLGLCAGAYALWRLAPAERAAAAGATGLALYGMGAAVLIAFGRIGYQNAFISRYITFANLFWIGVIALCFFAVRTAPNKRIGVLARALLGGLLLIKLATIGNVLTGANAGFAHAADIRRDAATICQAYPDISPALQASVAAPYQKAESSMAYIAEHRLSVFHECKNRAR